jgi:lipid II:glycine glycyltransferase (peptidoglycan interpeptide bridge formation enzyme)
MKSVYYTDAWKRLRDFSTIEREPYVGSEAPRILRLFSPRAAQMHFTLVDTNYEDLQLLLRDGSYKQAVDIQNCPAIIEQQLTHAGFAKRPWGTYIIDLQKPEEELWEAVEKEARKVIKKTMLAGCTVRRVSTEDELKAYWELVRDSRKQLGLGLAAYKYTLAQWRTLHPEHYEVFLVYHHDTLIAGMGVIFTQDHMVEVMAGRSEYSKEQKLYPNDVLKWEIIKWGREHGIRYYDLAGFNPNAAPGSKEEGIGKFKAKWGGDYYAWDFFERYGTRAHHRLLRVIERWVR